MDINERERTEWTNGWWASADKEMLRILLVGDSVTRQIRSSLELMLGNAVAVDLFASSLALYDKSLFNNLKIFLKEPYRYDVIILNYGGHHGFARRCAENRRNYDEYQKNYRKLFRLLFRKCKNIVIMTATSMKKKPEFTQTDEEREQEIVVRNALSVEVGAKNKCRVFDLYTLMKEDGSCYAYSDAVHFVREADLFIASKLSGFLCTEGLIKESESRMSYVKKRMEDYLGGNRKYVIYGGGGYWQGAVSFAETVWSE